MPESTEAATLLESYTEMTELLLPNDTNGLGRALGGVVLHWMDICGAIAAMRFSNRQCVTAAMEHVDFITPIDLGEVATIEAYVFATGQTSLDVRVHVEAEDPRSSTDPRRTTTSFFTFVALDDDGDPTPVPRLQTPTEAQSSLQEQAREERREQLADVAERLEE
ncbi:MAG: acyl-CoA thioesterase [Halobacteriaceae archaeon]